jgi:pyruvate,water dikinase
MKNLFRVFGRSKKNEIQEGSLQKALKRKYVTFQNLLRENNNVLELMADMEEKLSGEYLFDRQYINKNVKAVADGVLKIIESINELSENKYQTLYKCHANINEKVQKLLSHKPVIQVSDLTISLDQLNKDMTNVSGGKMSHLGEIKNRLRLPAPDGFSISAYAYKRFIEHNRLAEKINAYLSEANIENMEALNEISRQIQQIVIEAELPEDLRDAINKEVEGLKLKLQPSVLSLQPSLKVSVRSSAIREDGEFSFAGQYSTFLNVPEDLIIQKYKEVVASLFTPRAIFYYKTKGFCEEDMVMSVGVMKMIEARSGGVIYTKDPNNPESGVVLINAVWGLGTSVVDGTEMPNFYSVMRETGAIAERQIPEQQNMAVCTIEGDIQDVGVPDGLKNRPCLTDDQVAMLFKYAVALEKHYGCPQDIEWAIDLDNQIFILQSRPLRMLKVESSTLTVPRRIEKYNIMLDKGVIACKGIGCGKAFVLKDHDELEHFPEGAVLVARHTSPKFVTVMNKAAAIITDVGSATGHMASLSREYQVPTILDTETATRIIKDGQELTVDAFNCNVYEGRVEELVSLNLNAHRSTFKDTHLLQTLEKVLKLIVPLNLIDPDRENFKPEFCETFHDITRFTHEMAMAEIFRTREGEHIESLEDLLSFVAFAETDNAKRIGEQTVILKAGIPMDARLLNIDGGIRKHDLKKATPEDITSVPFSAFLKGMMNMKWPEPRSVDAKGFFEMIANTAATQEEELLKMGGRSYAIISQNYMNFSIRLGYHFSLVEAYTGENLNDNYIKFFFKGGGAASDRRLRRVRLITEIIKKLDFRVKVTGDVINAILTKYNIAAIEERLMVMGKLTAYTKQLDMVMYNDAITDMFIEDFIRDHVKLS